LLFVQFSSSFSCLLSFMWCKLWHPKQRLQLMTFLRTEFRNSSCMRNLATSGDGPLDFHLRSQQATAKEQLQAWGQGRSEGTQPYAPLIYLGAHHEGRACLGGGANVPPRGRSIMPPSSLGGGGGTHACAPHGHGTRTYAPPTCAPRVGRIQVIFFTYSHLSS
jgi:hypothetical protein